MAVEKTNSSSLIPGCLPCSSVVIEGTSDGNSWTELYRTPAGKGCFDIDIYLKYAEAVGLTQSAAAQPPPSSSNTLAVETTNYSDVATLIPIDIVEKRLDNIIAYRAYIDCGNGSQSEKSPIFNYKMTQQDIDFCFPKPTCSNCNFEIKIDKQSCNYLGFEIASLAPSFQTTTCTNSVSIGWGLSNGTCPNNCVKSVKLQHASTPSSTFRDSSTPAALGVTAGFFDLCNELKFYVNGSFTPEAFAVKLKVTYEDNSVDYSLPYWVFPPVRWKNTTSDPINTTVLTQSYCGNRTFQTIQSFSEICLYGTNYEDVGLSKIGYFCGRA